MGKVWILDTETKGTGAQMVPLEKALQKPGPKPRLATVPPNPRPRPEEAPREPQPPKFKVVDAMTRQVLAEDADVRAAVGALEGLRSVVDVSIYRRDGRASAWRPLSIGERKKLWSLRERGVRR
jgi:hypothetical protein